MPLPAGHYWFPWLPDYASGISDRPEASATLADAITGKEERAVWLPRARRTLGYRLAPADVATGVRMTDMLRAARVTGRVSIPHWGRGRVLTAYAPGSAVVTTAQAHGLAVGGMAALYRPGDEQAALVEVAAVGSPANITLTAPIPAGWTGHVWITPVLHGRLQEPTWAPLSDLRRIAVEFVEFPPAPSPLPNWQAFETDSSHVWTYGVPPVFAMFLCLDETGSIGIGGALRGIEIIDTYGERVGALGFVSFGDVMCKTYPITEDVAAVRAYLQAVVDYEDPEYSEFFQDGGGDTPENGVDALATALAAHAAFDSGLPRLVFLKTDTWGYANHTAVPATVNLALQSLYGTWLEFGEEGIGEGTSYAIGFPETERVKHSTFPDVEIPE